MTRFLSPPSPMELLPLFAAFAPSSKLSPLRPFSPPIPHLLLRRRRLPTAARSPPPRGCGQTETAASSGDFRTDSETVEVFGIGSRKDAVLSFCLESPLQSPSLRYWNIIAKDSTKVQLQQRVIGKDPNPRIFEALPYSASPSKTIILVASAGYGIDHKSAIDILETVRSAHGFIVAIILKPFSFEGQRRQDEVKELMEKLREQANLIIDLDTDKLLKKDMVTLDEAVKTANNAVLLAITAIAALKSDLNQTFIGSSLNNVKNIDVSEVFRILERYKEAKLGFGASYNIKSSILQAIYDCPFLSMGVKDFDGIVICILASSDPINESDVNVFLQNFRLTAEYTKEILLSTIHEPNLEPNLLVTTVLAVGTGFTQQEASQKGGILTRLAKRFSFILTLLRGRNLQSGKTQENSGIERVRTSVGKELPEENIYISAVDAITEGSDKNSEKLWAVNSNNSNDSQTSSSDSESERRTGEFFESVTEPSGFQDPSAEEASAFQREELVGWNSGMGYQIAREWAKERAAEVGATSKLDKLSIFCLPVGVRPSEESKDRFTMSSPTQYPTLNSEDVVKSKPNANINTPSLNELTDTGLEAMKDFYNTASALLKGNSMDPPKKQGILSARAASMLEAERDSPKNWSPAVEMKYRGGIYKGRCQGGLPEGKGRLVLGDGSIYDGIWRYGKRSGSGTLYFSNGDVFQGSWRDDVMHGKGWFYFHTGDRWFANFWKGKANGEGRFYSKSGEVLFGHFQDGWRHGKFICINVDGKRCVEMWDHGILVSRSPLES